MTIAELHALFLKCNSVNTDTRILQPGDLYFALRGENFNGNAFVKDALQKGAAYCVVDEKEYHLSNGKTILVNNSLETLQNLASHHRKFLSIPILALTGSNGKTTSKELISAILSQKFNTCATQGNLNNHIGVPLTLLAMNENTELGIVEMGASHPGEIAALCEIAQPDYGYITNFGRAHLEGFGSIDGVIKAKTELYRYIALHNKTLFVNTDDQEQVKQAQKTLQITFGQTEENDICIKQQNNPLPFLSVIYNNTEIKSKLIGNYNFSNIGVAITVGQFFGVSLKQIKDAIENYRPDKNRSQIVVKGSNTLILDAYNANPSSVEAAIRNFHQIQAESKIIFFGDMLELGTFSEKEHQYIVDLVKELKFNSVYLVGENFFKTSVNSPYIKTFATFEDLVSAIDFSTISNCHILIKGSRGMKMERLLDFL